MKKKSTADPDAEACVCSYLSLFLQENLVFI